MNEDERVGFVISSEMDARDAWALFYRNALTKCAEEFEADPSRDNQLAALIELTRQLITYSTYLPLPDEPIDPLDIEPLQRLLEALVDIQGGHSVELLDPSRSQGRFRRKSTGTYERTPGRRKSRHASKRLRAVGVAFVRLLTSPETGSGKAARTVAKRFTEAGLCGHSGGEITKSSVQTWIREIETGARPDEQRLAAAYEAFLRQRLRGAAVDSIEAELRIQADALSKR